VTLPLDRRLLWGLAAAAAAAIAVSFGGGNDGDIAAPATREGRSEAAPERSARSADKGPPPALNLASLDAARAFPEKKTDLLAAKSWYVPPPPPPPEKPKAPPLPFKFTGRLIENGQTTVFLSSQDRNEAAHLGDVLDKAWRVDRISPTSMTLTYLPLDQTQTLALGAAP
jgi:hypothetical protein